MEKLSIEEKAAHYDKAIERANSLLSGNQLGNAWIYKLLPELEESGDEYKNNYAPMKRETYERRKQMIKESYKLALAEIEKEYEEKGKFSPDYHKI